MALPAYNTAQVSEKEAWSLTRMVMKMFELWSLTYEEQATLLGLSTRTNNTISRYKRALAPIRFDRDTYDRVSMLLSIHQSLRQLFPSNKELAYRWMKVRNAQFRHKTPVEHIAEKGMFGIWDIQTYLQNQQAL